MRRLRILEVSSGLISKARRILAGWLERFERRPRWKAVLLPDDNLPDDMPALTVFVTHDGGEKWSAGLLCPCGCGDTIELPLFPEADQCWSIHIDRRSRPTLRPSIWRKRGCRSHFFLREGLVMWCSDSQSTQH